MSETSRSSGCLGSFCAVNSGLVASSTLAEALQGLSSALLGLLAELTEEGVIEAPDLALIGEEIIELPGNIVDCAELAAELFG